jgi:hypothetical protein
MRGGAHHLLVYGGPDSADWKPLQAAAGLAGGHAGLIEAHCVVGRMDDGAAAPENVYADVTGKAHGRYGLTGPGLYLLRPDGYVGFRAPGLDAAPLDEYFQTLLRRGSAAPATAG